MPVVVEMEVRAQETCQFCLDEEVTPLTGPLLTPCLCGGTATPQGVHERCAIQAVLKSEKQIVRCSACLYAYRGELRSKIKSAIRRDEFCYDMKTLMMVYSGFLAVLGVMFGVFALVGWAVTMEKGTLIMTCYVAAWIFVMSMIAIFAHLVRFLIKNHR